MIIILNVFISFISFSLTYVSSRQYFLYNIEHSPSIDLYDIRNEKDGVQDNLKLRLLLKNDIHFKFCKSYEEGERVILFCVGDLTGIIYRVREGVDHERDSVDTNASVQVFEDGIASSNVQIAIDNVHGQIYWLDEVRKRIQTRAIASYSESSNASQTVIYNAGNTDAIACDGSQGFLFWSSHRSSSYIKRSDLSGDNKKVLVTYIRSPVSVLFTDQAAGALYWLDDFRQTLEYVIYNGGDRGFIAGFNANNRMVLFNIGENRLLYATPEDVYYSKITTSSESRTQTSVFIRHLPQETNLIGVQESLTLSADCKRKRCSHFCVKKNPDIECVCKKGYSLLADNRTCSSPVDYVQDGIFLGINGNVFRTDINIQTGVPTRLNQLPAVRNSTRFKFIGRNMYYTFENGTHHMLLRYFLNSLYIDEKPVLVSDSVIRDFVCDTNSNEIYYLAGDELRVSGLHSGENKLLISNMINVSSIDLDPRTRVIVMSSIHTSKIEIYDVIANTRTIVTQAFNPYFVGFDNYSHRLIFAVSGGIKSMERDGTDIQVLHKLASQQTALAINKDSLLYSGTQGGNTLLNVIHQNNPDVVSSSEIGQNMTVHCIAVLDEGYNQENKDLCAENNGGCQQICSYDSEIRCSCYPGFNLVEGSCGTVYVPNAALLLSTSDNLIYQYDEESSNVTAVDFISDKRISDIAKNHQTDVVYAVVRDRGEVVEINLKTQQRMAYSFQDFNPAKVEVYHSMNRLLIVNQTNSANRSILCSYLPSNKTFSKIFEIEDPITDVAVHDKNQLAFITTGKIVLKIDVITRKQLDFVNHGLERPTKIQVDPKENYVYVVDFSASTSRLIRTGLDGEHLTIVHFTNLEIIKDISVAVKEIFVITSNNNMIKIHKTTLRIIEIVQLLPIVGHIGTFIAHYTGNIGGNTETTVPSPTTTSTRISSSKQMTSTTSMTTNTPQQTSTTPSETSISVIKERTNKTNTMATIVTDGTATNQSRTATEAKSNLANPGFEPSIQQDGVPDKEHALTISLAVLVSVLISSLFTFLAVYRYRRCSSRLQFEGERRISSTIEMDQVTTCPSTLVATQDSGSSSSQSSKSYSYVQAHDQPFEEPSTSETGSRSNQKTNTI